MAISLKFVMQFTQNWNIDVFMGLPIIIHNRDFEFLTELKNQQYIEVDV